MVRVSGSSLDAVTRDFTSVVADVAVVAAAAAAVVVCRATALAGLTSPRILQGNKLYVTLELGSPTMLSGSLESANINIIIFSQHHAFKCVEIRYKNVCICFWRFSTNYTCILMTCTVHSK